MAAALVRAAIQHHPSRAYLLPPLLRSLRGLRPEVITDPEPDAAPGPWRSYKRCLESAPAAATHLLVVQDDATLCPGFATAIRRIAEVSGPHPVCLFHGKYPRTTAIQVERAAERGESLCWITVAQWVPLICTLWPVETASRVAADVGNPALPYADDGLVGKWLTRHRVSPLVAIPNLAQHEDVVPSLMTTRLTMPRRSLCWIGDFDVRDVDWRIPD